MKEKIAKLIRDNDEYTLKEFIKRYMNGDTERFLEIVRKYELMEDEEIFDNLVEMFPMSYFKTKYESNSESTIKYIMDKYFSDVVNVNGNRYMLILKDREDLSNLFKDDGGRNDMGSRELAKVIFQEDWWDAFDDTYSDIYEDIVQELNSENLYRLAESINKELLNQEITPETSLLEDIAEDQGHPDFVILSTDLILNEIFNDKETTKYLLNNVTNFGSDLSSLHHNAANTAYIDEKWEDVTEEIKSLLSIDNIGGWTNRKITNYKGEEKNISRYEIEITNIIPNVIESILNDSYYINNEENIFGYYSDFENLLTYLIDEKMIEGASMNIPYYDYPDSTRTSKYLNELFGDYI